MKPASRLPDVGTTIFTIMSQMAIDHHAINLGQGYPDFSPDPALLELVNKAMLDGHNQYPPMAGVPLLREKISEKTRTLYGHTYDPASEITITSGATQALMASILALVHPGEEVLVLEPVYDVYIPAILLAGAIPVVVPMSPPGAASKAYCVDWERVRHAITPKTKMLILNFPHNPTGAIFTQSDLDELEKIVSQHALVLLSDEVYEHITFDGYPHLSLATRPALANRSVVISSFGKTYHVTGWKIGYCCAPSALMAEIRKVHQFMVFSVNTPMQIALAAYLENTAAYLQLADFYQRQRDYLHAGLLQTRFQPLPSSGTFFLLADYSKISDLPEIEFTKWLTTEYGVTAIPVSAFYKEPNAKASNHQLLRFCFAKETSTLNTALERLLKV